MLSWKAAHAYRSSASVISPACHPVWWRRLRTRGLPWMQWVRWGRWARKGGCSANPSPSEYSNGVGPS